jgi:ribonuclease P/MRP protein subunit RPP40
LDKNPGGHIQAISVDWEKAFDRVPHQRLLFKLQRAGINGNLFAWFCSYLSNRKQRVLFGNEFSDEFNVQSGAIQGSGLGPILFNIFVSDLSQFVKSDLVMYADDSTLYRHIKSYDEELILQDVINNIVLWSINNGMHLNALKCNFMDITLSSLRRFVLYSINGSLIEHANYLKI